MCVWLSIGFRLLSQCHTTTLCGKLSRVGFASRTFYPLLFIMMLD